MPRFMDKNGVPVKRKIDKKVYNWAGIADSSKDHNQLKIELKRLKKEFPENNYRVVDHKNNLKSIFFRKK